MSVVSDAVWRCRHHEFSLGERTLVMGIVNVTPDSFSDGGLHPGADDAVAHGLRLAAEGADILDIGGESTRPGSDPVAPDEELERVLPVVAGLREAAPAGVALSVDTRRPQVAQAAIDAGASIVNDVTAAADPAMFEVARDAGAGLVLMHMLGEPKTMQDDPTYVDVVAEVRDFLARRLGAAVAAGLERDRLCVDPGIGFGKTLAHNLALLHDIEAFSSCGCRCWWVPRARASSASSRASTIRPSGWRAPPVRWRGARRTASTWYACTTCCRWPVWCGWSTPSPVGLLRDGAPAAAHGRDVGGHDRVP